MIPVRLKQYFDFGDKDGIIWRDVQVSAIIPGMKFANIFGLANDPSDVETWEYDVKEGRFIAWLKDNPLVEEHFTFEELAEKGEFVDWDTSDFSAHQEA